MDDRKLVTDFLKDKNIDVVLSSPYKRSVDTVKDLADMFGFHIETIFDFRERKMGSVWIDDFTAFSKRQWVDFDYKDSDGESLREVQHRNVTALKAVIKKYENQNIVIGSHGTALSTIINYYNSAFGCSAFETIKSLMPWIVKITFAGSTMQRIETFDVFAK